LEANVWLTETGIIDFLLWVLSAHSDVSGSLATFLHLRRILTWRIMDHCTPASGWANLFSWMIVSTKECHMIAVFFACTALIGTLCQAPLFFLFGDSQLSHFSTEN